MKAAVCMVTETSYEVSIAAWIQDISLSVKKYLAAMRIVNPLFLLIPLPICLVNYYPPSY